MNRIKLCGLVFVGLAYGSSAWGLSSPFPSCVEGIEIPNTHALDEDGLVLRGMAPRNRQDIEALRTSSIDTVLIFKNQVKLEVHQETIKLRGAGFSGKQIKIIPFKWKEHENFTYVCKQTLEAMNLIENQRKNNKSIFFHCTVGEDRTGYLAGLMRWWWEEGSVTEIFETEMCWNGYGAGNPKKPYKQVVKKIRDSLTPLFVKMTYVLAGAKSLDADKLCAKDPAELVDFQNGWALQYTQLRCQESPRYKLKDDPAASCSL